MKKILKKVFCFFSDSISFLSFILEVIYNGNFISRLPKSSIKTAVVLANGPSLKKELPRLTKAKEFKNVDYFVLNYFANEDVFFQIKPKHYCFADPMFFQYSHRQEEVKSLFKLLEEKIDWGINIYIPSNLCKKFKDFSGFTNPNMKIVRINSTEFRGYEKFRNFFYKKGLSIPFIGSVVNLAIFVAINKRFKYINVYGVDHTFFDCIEVNNQNQLCIKQTHFYSDKDAKSIPILRVDNGENLKISDHLFSVTKVFESHDYLYKYSKYLNIKITNYTKKSLIDSYDRA